ncbi:MAG: MFS transporter [Armatimonadetes bacterium]|nr:MFS transporter [Armatimonadota bacterium]
MSPLVAVFLTVFFDLMSFGSVIPDVQLRAERLGATGWIAGLVIAMFSITQFCCAPFLGRLSDRIGRRKVLVVTSALAVAASLLYGHSDTLAIMLASRAVLGMAGANLGVAYAYVSDVTKPEDRAAAMGKIGMAFGLGFVFGPPLGAKMVELGGGQPLLLSYVSAAFALVNLAFVLFFMPEVPVQPESSSERSLNPFAKLLYAMRTPGLGFLLALFFVANFAFANLESTYFRLAHDTLGIDQFATSLVLVFVGIVAAVMQGALIPILAKRFGEASLLRVAYVLQGPVLAAMPFSPVWGPQLFLCLLLGTSNGLAQPNLSSLISRAAPATMVGGIFGVTQSLGALARIIGPIVGNSMYDWRHWMPYAFAGGLMLVPLVMSQFVRMPQGTRQAEAPVS